MEGEGIDQVWTDPTLDHLDNFTDANINDMLQDDRELQQFIANMALGEDTSLNENLLFSTTSLSSMEGFDQQSFSASDSSLADQYSPTTTTYSSLSQYGDQYSPSTGSVDSGLPNDFGDSPILSPDSLSLDMANAPMKDDVIMPTGGIDNQISPQLLVKLIQQQVQQALTQQQQQQQEQQQQQQQQTREQLELQQRMTMLSQQKLLTQRNAQLIQHDINASVKSDSQLRKMLLQTKNNIAQTKNTIINSLQDKKEKISKVLPKPGNIMLKPGIIKPGKRKIQCAHDDVKVEKMPALVNNNPFNVLAAKDNQLSNDPTNLQALLLNQNVINANDIPSVLPQISSPINHDIMLSGHQQKPDTPSNTLPTTATYSIPSLQPTSKGNNSNNSALPIKPTPSEKPNKFKKIDAAKKAAKVEGKKSRVEHVVIEKRYRMKITDSLNELKNMLPGADEKKATKNSILQAAIEEIKRLKKQNDTLRRRFDKMKKVFEDLKNVGILTSSQCCLSSSSSESNISDEYTSENTSSSASSDSTSGSLEPEVNQDHYASPFQRQSARDGAKSLACLTIFLFLFVNPLNWLAGKSSTMNGATTFTSRHLLNVREQETSPEFSLVSNLVNIVLSLVILMLMVLRGNPKCHKSSKLTQCFKSQFRKAQKKINKGDYESAKESLRIGLFLIGNSCPKTFYGQMASFSWKCICHMLYQLGILTILESIGHSILPAAICLSGEKEEKEFAAKMSAKAYKKLHEISLKEKGSTYLESACYIMNAIYAAEVSCDKELLCTIYATAVVHMRERLWSSISQFPQYYFTCCAHHVSLASKEGAFAVDWIFETRGYEYFTSGNWDINRGTVFTVNSEDSKLDENDLLQIVFVQFQEHLLTKALKRIVVPESSYPNEGKIELRQRALSYLEKLGTGPVSEQVDPVSMHHQSLYLWWGNTLKQLVNVLKNSWVEDDELKFMCDMFDEIHEQHRHPIVTVGEAVVTSYIYIRNMKHYVEKMKVMPVDLQGKRDEVQDQLLEASRMIENMKSSISCSDSAEKEVEELLFILCCELMIDSYFMLWQYDSRTLGSEQQLTFLVNENSILQMFALKYPELASKIQTYEREIQCMSGSNQAELSRMMKKTQYVKSISCHENQTNGLYFEINE